MPEFQPFDSFDPLEAKTAAATEVKLKALKNEIKGILTSYVGWYDPFCETIQNAMDAVEKRAEKENGAYQPRIWITSNTSSAERYLPVCSLAWMNCSWVVVRVILIVVGKQVWSNSSNLTRLPDGVLGDHAASGRGRKKLDLYPPL